MKISEKLYQHRLEIYLITFLVLLPIFLIVTCNDESAKRESVGTRAGKIYKDFKEASK